MFSSVARVGLESKLAFDRRIVYVEDEPEIRESFSEMIDRFKNSGDTLNKEDVLDTFEKAVAILPELKEDDIFITDGHLGSENDSKEGTGEGDGLILLEKHATHIEKKAMLSSDLKLREGAVAANAAFIDKNEIVELIDFLA